MCLDTENWLKIGLKVSKSFVKILFYQNLIVSDKWLQNRNNASNLYRLITAYRVHGHKYANTNTFSSLDSKE